MKEAIWFNENTNWRPLKSKQLNCSICPSSITCAAQQKYEECEFSFHIYFWWRNWQRLAQERGKKLFLILNFVAVEWEDNLITKGHDCKWGSQLPLTQQLEPQDRKINLLTEAAFTILEPGTIVMVILTTWELKMCDRKNLQSAHLGRVCRGEREWLLRVRERERE